MEDYNNFLKMIQKVNHKYLAVRDIDPKTGLMRDFIAIEDDVLKTIK